MTSLFVQMFYKASQLLRFYTLTYKLIYHYFPNLLRRSISFTRSSGNFISGYGTFLFQFFSCFLFFSIVLLSIYALCLWTPLFHFIASPTTILEPNFRIKWKSVQIHPWNLESSSHEVSYASTNKILNQKNHLTDLTWYVLRCNFWIVSHLGWHNARCLMLYLALRLSK